MKSFLSRTLFVPEIGTELKLAEDWYFNLYAEYRNETLGKLHGFELQWLAWEEWSNRPEEFKYLHYTWIKDGERKYSIPVVIPAGTILKVDRIYIRKGNKDFSSITFTAPKFASVEMESWNKTKYKRGIRFWAKLSECNTIIFE